MNNSLKNSFKWKTLQHNGVAFPPDYSYKRIKIGIKNDQFQLNNDQEELIYAWAKKKDSHYIRDDVFQKNFLTDLKKLLPARFQYIKNISDIDFSEAFGLVDEEQRIKYLEKEKIKSLPREEKKKLSAEKKKQKESLKKTYGIAIIDGVEVEVANWLVEPPGLFMGRGLHPPRGRWKPRIRPKDVILNLDENSPVPEGAWKKVVHDHSSTWLATWTETLTSKRKYVWLHDSALLRQDKDREKYDKAKNLEKHVEKIEKDIINKMINEKDLNQKKIATVCYLI